MSEEPRGSEGRPVTEDPAPRRAPLYGEYATPEEVAEITGRPVEQPDPEEAARVAERAAARGEAPRSSLPASPVASDSDAEQNAEDAAVRRRTLWDAALTFALLAAGAWNAVGMVLDPDSLGRSLQETARNLGYPGDITGEPTHGIGVVLAVVVPLLVVICAVLSTIARRRGMTRVFWIPLSGAVLSLIAILVCMVLAIAAHPDFAAVVLRS